MSENKTNVNGASKKKYSKKSKKLTKKVVADIARSVITQKQEKHYFDVNNSASVSASGTIIALSQIPAGTGDTTRIGDGIEITSINVRMQWYWGDDTNVCRAILFQYIGDSAVPPATIEIIQNDILGFVGAPSGQYSKDYCGYTWIPLADKMITLAGNTGNTTQSSVKLMDFKLTAKDLKKGKKTPKIQFQGAGILGVGHIYMMVLSDSTAPLPHPTVYYDSRIRFLTA